MADARAELNIGASPAVNGSMVDRSFRKLFVQGKALDFKIFETRNNE